MAHFEFVTAYKERGLVLPERKTAFSAGYDLAAAEDIVIPTYMQSFRVLDSYITTNNVVNLSEIAQMTKETGAKPTLVPTGLKCYLDEGTYLSIQARSSLPLKHWLIVANAPGIIDRDYADSASSEGHIYVQLINLGPRPIMIKKGDLIAQAIIQPYLTTEDDAATGERTGGFGSTSAHE